MVFKLNNQMLSKMAIGDGHGENNFYFNDWKAYDSDPYHHHNKLDGVIQMEMGLVENQLCFDLVEEWLKKNPAASICNPEGVGGFKDVAIFQDYHGLPKSRNVITPSLLLLKLNKV
ncbi:unnamed protein product [Linum tenue]|uniref:1-aminocyclopropane-1-carboxylate synthase n=1 Tax=Linum tenue TaxID=586396 RepID=A0AAV0MEL2_9ROSI|nr:unnamed protein product [Linum tenue]